MPDLRDEIKTALQDFNSQPLCGRRFESWIIWTV